MKKTLMMTPISVGARLKSFDTDGSASPMAERSM